MTPALIAEIAALIAQLGPLGLQLFTSLEGLLNLTPDEKTNVANAVAAAKSADQATINAVAAWMAANGFVPQFVPSGSPVAPTTTVTTTVTTKP
jgi:hypothetical protein